MTTIAKHLGYTCDTIDKEVQEILNFETKLAKVGSLNYFVF